MKLTPEQVGKLRLPDGFRLVNVMGIWGLHHDYMRPATSADVAFAQLAEAVADGEIDESVLIAAWAARDSKVEYYTYGMWGGDECLNKFDSIGVAQDNLDHFDHEAEYGIIIKLGP